MQLNLKNLSAKNLAGNLESLVRSERKITAEILEYVKEIDRRRLYIELGHTSLFAYLTKGLRYTPASAQRRIEAARLMKTVPEISEDIANGALNLSQVALVAQGIREKIAGDKKAQSAGRAGSDHPGALKAGGDAQQTALQLFEQIKHKDIAATQIAVAKKLDLKMKRHEAKRFQKDESLRLEITLSPEQQKLFAQARELLSHVKHNPNWIELFELLAKDSIKMRDPLAKKGRSTAASSTQVVRGVKPVAEADCRTRATGAVAPQRHPLIAGGAKFGTTANWRAPIPSAVKRVVLQRDKCCRWRDPRTGVQCSSRFQLQLDHIDPIREGGGNAPENLQLLCSVHNRHKYRREIWHQR